MRGELWIRKILMTITVQKSNIVTITHRLVNITILERITAIVIRRLMGILALLMILVTRGLS
ncbi:hypothetical protein CS369_17125 [Candidatus Symbiopectobacterium sp. 'North America']|nr:hypothetical protein [Candidatus Symbiopectobacterium sp. 'North America']